MEYSSILPLQTYCYQTALAPAYYCRIPTIGLSYSYSCFAPHPNCLPLLPFSPNDSELAPEVASSPPEDAGSSERVPLDPSAVGRRGRREWGAGVGGKYAKKNAESNVINQVFSYISLRAKSNKAVSRLLNFSEESISLYY